MAWHRMSKDVEAASKWEDEKRAQLSACFTAFSLQTIVIQETVEERMALNRRRTILERP